jgi:hypothetical protein
MNSKSTDSYILHKFNLLTHIAVEESVQPRVYTFAQKANPQVDCNTQPDILIINNESELIHPSVNSAEPLGNREDSQCKPTWN